MTQLRIDGDADTAPVANTLRDGVVRRGVTFALALCVLGCSATVVSMNRGPRAYTASDYPDVYEAWTRTEDDFAWGQFRDVLHVTATFESWEFRWAYVVRFAEDHSILPEARDEMLRATLDDSQEHHRFFVTLAGDQFRESNLSGRLSAWRVLLVAPDGSQTESLDMERIRRPTAAERVYFPSVSSFRESFRIVFPAQREDGSASIPADASHMILRFTGARGRVDMRWDFDAAGGPEPAPETAGGDASADSDVPEAADDNVDPAGGAAASEPSEAAPGDDASAPAGEGAPAVADDPS